MASFSRTAAHVAMVFVLVVIPAATASAQRHRARLSADLADHLAADSAAIEVIVDGDAASIERLARQYNVVVKRSLRRGGAVLRVNAGQLAALQQDEAVDHLAGNVRYKSGGPAGLAGRAGLAGLAGLSRPTRWPKASASIRCGPAWATCRSCRGGASRWRSSTRGSIRSIRRSRAGRC